jgi:hypothetical protein
LRPYAVIMSVQARHKAMSAALSDGLLGSAIGLGRTGCSCPWMLDKMKTVYWEEHSAFKAGQGDD